MHLYAVDKEQQGDKIQTIGNGKNGEKPCKLALACRFSFEGVRFIEQVGYDQTHCVTDGIAYLGRHAKNKHAGENDAVAQNCIEHADYQEPRKLFHLGRIA